MRILEIHIEVSDIDASLEFYKKLLPYHKLTKWSDKKAYAFILDDGSAFGIWEKGKMGLHKGQAGEHVHYAFQISPDEYALYKLKLLTIPVEIIEHQWGDGHRSLYFFDPDNHQGEFMTKDWLKQTAGQ